jgi:hypothetical protein
MSHGKQRFGRNSHRGLLNTQDVVSPETAERVYAAIEKLSYERQFTGPQFPQK